MGMSQSLGNITRYAQSLSCRQAPLLFYKVFQCTARYIFHDDIVIIAFHAYVKDIYDIGMGQAGCSLGLLMEFVDEFAIAFELVMEYLHRHGTIKQFVPGPVNICHASPAYELLQLIALM
jgi:hypothetical protein